MRRLALPVLLALAAPLLAALPSRGQAPGYTPGPENVALPPAYQAGFIRYAAVDKPDRKIIRYLYVNPEAFAAARPGAPLPDGTVMVMEDHVARLGPDGTPLLDQQGRLIPTPAIAGLFVQEKRRGWGAGYPDALRNGEWEYARFNPDGSRHAGPVTACFECHVRQRAAQDFTFAFWDYVQTRR